jgi:hypothetical protein
MHKGRDRYKRKIQFRLSDPYQYNVNIKCYSYEQYYMEIIWNIFLRRQAS